MSLAEDKEIVRRFYDESGVEATLITPTSSSRRT